MVPVLTEWTRFYDDHYHGVVRFLMLNGARQADAEDAAGEAFTESYALAARNPGRWQAGKGKPAWIRTVALRRYRRPPGSRRRLLATGDPVPDLPAPEASPEDLTVQAQLVLRALLVLDEEARAVIAFDIDGIPPGDIAHELGISQQRVRDIRKRARTVLRQQFTGNTARGRGKQA
jgi:RNA polymerase sigma factor (sigma-70 family)